MKGNLSIILNLTNLIAYRPGYVEEQIKNLGSVYFLNKCEKEK